MTCNIRDDGLQFCACNNADLCNKLKRTMKCHVCDSNQDSPSQLEYSPSCSTKITGNVVDRCLSCFSLKVNEKRWVRNCLKGTDMAVGCSLVKDLHVCICDTNKCNGQDIDLPKMKCYVCEPKSNTDTSCNVVNSGRVQDGCLTCVTTIRKAEITTRSCEDFSRAPSSKIDEFGNTIVECDKDLCNGEGEAVKTTTSGLQKTVASRVLIYGLLAAMLGLAQLF